MDSGTLAAFEIDPELELEQEPLPELEPLPKPESLVEMCEPQSQPDAIPSASLPEFGPMNFNDQQKDRKRGVSTAIEELLVVDENMQKFLEYVKADRVIVDVKKIVGLFEGQCSEVGCSAIQKVVEKKLDAGVLLIIHKCSKGQSGIPSSLSVLGEKQGQKSFVSTVLLASSVLVSGTILKRSKYEFALHVLHNLREDSKSLYAVPSIRELWNKMKEVIWKAFENDVLVVCSDGRMDSPGFSAKYCVYTMMEQYLNVITDLEVIDKCETGSTSTLMEKMGCKRLLERMMDSLKLGEIVTDASTVIMKMVRELKDYTEYHLTIVIT